MGFPSLENLPSSKLLAIFLHFQRPLANQSLHINSRDPLVISTFQNTFDLYLFKLQNDHQGLSVFSHKSDHINVV